LGEKRLEIERFFKDIVGQDLEGYLQYIKTDPDADEVKEMKRLLTEEYHEMEYEEFKEAIDLWVDMNKALIRRYFYKKTGLTNQPEG